VIYATDSTVVISPDTFAFQIGSKTDYAVQEDNQSSLVTANLVMGNYYTQFQEYAPPSLVTMVENSLSTFNNTVSSFISGGGNIIEHGTTGTIANITINPGGKIDLGSPLNQITNLDSVLVGSGGLFLVDGVNLTIDPVGSSNGQNFGEIDEAPIGPVLIIAPNLIYIYPNNFINSKPIPGFLLPVGNSLADISQIFQPTAPKVGGGKGAGKVIGGAGGVASGQDHRGGAAFERAMAQKYGARAFELLQIIKQDLLDGSTVNTATLSDKWVANTGLSKLVGVNGNAELFDGLAQPMGNGLLILGQFQFGAGDLNALDRAAFGHTH
jgi:hypothetical protein